MVGCRSRYLMSIVLFNPAGQPLDVLLASNYNIKHTFSFQFPHPLNLTILNGASRSRLPAKTLRYQTSHTIQHASSRIT